ncbi:sugar phosphate isomerase/epimerase family protein [Tropicimonas sp. TH_r6]|uniref:sugar phosphate isomerase/epimerase family protein n=1 Tax=Tropicimonas sp. TH_r6 TaxID=3082085 RepID=UPI0029555EF8|nr:sugar phosphate isomerase/epimerase family protein [Tropicimonas sp. TH_r6]MDV7141129.1 sugar phosphate isomerase/epimerase family protein [Tropicimonas sp. TH_r6]
MSKYRWTRENWPIACAMIPFPGVAADGTVVQDAPAEHWAETLALITNEGFTELDPTDSWLRVADLEASRRNEFMAVVKEAGLTIPAISTSRKSPIDPERGDDNLAYCHKVIETAAEIGAESVTFGLFGDLTDAQKKALWFWTVDGVKNPDDPAIYNKAVERIRELGKHAAEMNIEVSLEMYEDTYIGTADGAVKFTQDVDLPNVGINADIGNLIRLHRDVEHWQDMMAKIAPFLKYWHVKNYMRVEDPISGAFATHPAPLDSGIINYRAAIALALSYGFKSAFLCEHYGGDGLSVCGANRRSLRRILPAA